LNKGLWQQEDKEIEGKKITFETEGQTDGPKTK
jgi:hypothetical protein